MTRFEHRLLPDQTLFDSVLRSYGTLDGGLAKLLADNPSALADAAAVETLALRDGDAIAPAVVARYGGRQLVSLAPTGHWAFGQFWGDPSDGGFWGDPGEHWLAD